MFTASIIALMMEAVSKSETSVNFYEIIRRNIPEDIFILAAVRKSEISYLYHDFVNVLRLAEQCL
jgi:hypothetical protein